MSTRGEQTVGPGLGLAPAVCFKEMVWNMRKKWLFLMNVSFVYSVMNHSVTKLGIVPPVRSILPVLSDMFLVFYSQSCHMSPQMTGQKCTSSASIGYGYGYDCGLWRHAPLESVQWPPPVRFSTSGITSGKVIPLKTPPFGCKYSTGEDHIVCQGCSYFCQRRNCT